MAARIKSRLGLFRELFRFLWRERLWWMIPMVVTLLLVGLLVVVSMNSAVAPFVYTLF
jgi:uncharacterized membrane protein